MSDTIHRGLDGSTKVSISLVVSAGILLASFWYHSSQIRESFRNEIQDIAMQVVEVRTVLVGLSEDVKQMRLSNHDFVTRRELDALIRGLRSEIEALKKQ